MATAAAQGYTRGDKPKPYRGYYFKFATEYGKAGGRAGAHFRLVAYPATWGVSGIMTFVTDERGELVQKNLGPETAEAASNLKFVQRDKGWEKVTVE